MGQRTAVVLQHVNNYAAKYDRSKKVSTRVFYHQWGIGRVLPSQLLAILNGTLSASSFCENFTERMKPAGCIDITNEYNKEDRMKMNDLDFRKPEEVGNIICRADNNNGGLFIRITTSKDGQKETIEYAYMLGYDYKRFCTFNEWSAKNYGDEYIDEDFMSIYKSTLKYFNAKERAPKANQLELFEKEAEL